MSNVSHFSSRYPTVWVPASRLDKRAKKVNSVDFLHLEFKLGGERSCVPDLFENRK